ncbi:MAG: class II aldolase/adducin family protein [Comamonadaceae bacterium]|nr:MAG: class II aldolase/adducin family protein [Comamonadaceae bacterium]
MSTFDHSTPSEAQTRFELAALYRLIAHFKMTDLIDTHISARVPGTKDQFLINRYGTLFHEVQPEDLVKIDPNGQQIDSLRDAGEVNVAGFTIHSAIHMARHDLECVIHTHTADGIAVACHPQGLLPISQHALKFYGRIGYHPYEGIAFDLGERERLVQSLGHHSVMVLQNHGLLAAGRTIAEAFLNIYFLERACQAQSRTLAACPTPIIPHEAVRQRTADQFHREEGVEHAQKVWQAALRLVS